MITKKKKQGKLLQAVRRLRKKHNKVLQRASRKPILRKRKSPISRPITSLLGGALIATAGAPAWGCNH